MSSASADSPFRVLLKPCGEMRAVSYDLGRQYEVWDCPFCGENTISIIHFPKSVSVKQSRAASLPGSKGFHVNRDVYLVQSGCFKCG